MSRSRSRLAADWFAKLRMNATTQEVEHIEVVEASETATAIDLTPKADVTYVDTEVAGLHNTVTSLAADKADVTAVYTKSQVEAKIVELAPATDISMKADTTYVDGVTASIQTQLNAKEPADATILKDADIGSTVLAPNGDGSQLTGIDALPDQTGHSGKYLNTDGTGASWQSISSDPTMGGDLSGTASNAQIVANAVGTSEIANSAVTDAKISGMSSSKLSGALPAIDGSALTGMPAGGKVLQLKFGYTNTVTAVGNTSEFDVVSVTITPSSTTSKIYLSGNLFAGTQGGSNNVVWWFRRGGVNIGRFTDSNREGGNSSFEASGGLEEIWNGAGFWLDSPATTSAVTYYLRVTGDDGSGLIINRVGSSSDAVWAKRTYSTITAMEIIV